MAIADIQSDLETQKKMYTEDLARLNSAISGVTNKLAQIEQKLSDLNEVNQKRVAYDEAVTAGKIEAIDIKPIEVKEIVKE